MEKFITLTITSDCNLNCGYCYETNKDKSYLFLDTAVAIIDKEFNLEPNFNSIYLQFFGGEPFLNFSLLKSIVEYIRSKNFSFPYKLNVTTNGTLVHGEIKDWLIENLDIIVCGLSLDGLPLSHNYNRCNSFEEIDLDFFAQYYPSQTIKMTISEFSLNYLYENIKFCHEYGFRVFCNLAYGIDWSNPRNEEILNHQLNLLIDYYLANPNIEPCSLLDFYFSDIAIRENARDIKKWCAVGTRMMAFDTNGNKFPCQMFMSISCTNSKDYSSIMFLEKIPESLLDDKCQSCCARHACPTCYGSNYISFGNIYHKDDNMCKLTKQILKARAYFKFKLWQANRLNLTDSEEYFLLKSIKIINENL